MIEEPGATPRQPSPGMADAATPRLSDAVHDKSRFRSDVFAVVGTLAGRNVHADTMLAGAELGWDDETIKLVGNGIEARLTSRGCRVRPVPDVDYELCRTLDDLAEVVWRHIVRPVR